MAVLLLWILLKLCDLKINIHEKFNKNSPDFVRFGFGCYVCSRYGFSLEYSDVRKVIV